MPHRPPTIADIGRTVQLSVDQTHWFTEKLAYIIVGSDGPIYYAFPYEHQSNGYPHCRVIYECADPVAELSEAADAMASVGADYAASMLLECLRILQMNNGAEPAVVANYLRIDT